MALAHIIEKYYLCTENNKQNGKGKNFISA